MTPLRRTSTVVLVAMLILAVPAVGISMQGMGQEAGNDGPVDVGNAGPISIADDGVTVTDLRAPPEAAVGDVIRVRANVSYAAEAEAPLRTRAEFRLDGDLVASTPVTLQPGDGGMVTFRVNTSGLAPGRYIHGILLADSGAQTTIRLYPADARDPAQPFDVTNLDAPSTVAAGDPVTVTADVTNPAEGDGEPTTQVVKFRLDGETLAEEFVTLAPGETATVEFAAPTDGLEGSIIVGVYSAAFGDVALVEVTTASEPTETPTESPTDTPAETESPTDTPAETESPTDTPAETESPTDTPAETESPTPEEPAEETVG